MMGSQCCGAPRVNRRDLREKPSRVTCHYLTVTSLRTTKSHAAHGRQQLESALRVVAGRGKGNLARALLDTAPMNGHDDRLLGARRERVPRGVSGRFVAVRRCSVLVVSSGKFPRPGSLSDSAGSASGVVSLAGQKMLDFQCSRAVSRTSRARGYEPRPQDATPRSAFRIVSRRRPSMSEDGNLCTINPLRSQQISSYRSRKKLAWP
jgi:hypothetical protein